MSAQRDRRTVANPILALDGVAELCALPPETRAIMIRALQAMRKDALARGQKCWDTHKAPMAVYWKAVGVNAGHFARVLS